MSKRIKAKRKAVEVVKKYFVRGKEYEQHKIVLAQFYRILTVMGIDPNNNETDQDPPMSFHIKGIPLLLSIILNEPDQPPCEEGEQEDLAKKLGCIIDLETQVRMVQDFIELNDFALIGRQMREIAKTLAKGILN